MRLFKLDGSTATQSGMHQKANLSNFSGNKTWSAHRATAALHASFNDLLVFPLPPEAASVGGLDRSEEEMPMSMPRLIPLTAILRETIMSCRRTEMSRPYVILWSQDAICLEVAPVLHKGVSEEVAPHETKDYFTGTDEKVFGDQTLSTPDIVHVSELHCRHA